MKELPGQISIWDIHEENKKRKPCEYSLQRYIGQMVRCNWSGRIGYIVEIDKYYTDVKCIEDDEIYAWTPTNTTPFQFVREEWYPITGKKYEWDKARTHIPLVKLIEPSKSPQSIDLVIDGTVDGKPALIGFMAWVSGFGDCFKEYEPVLYKLKN